MHSPVRIGCLELAGDPKYAPEAQTPSCPELRTAKPVKPCERQRECGYLLYVLSHMAEGPFCENILTCPDCHAIYMSGACLPLLWQQSMS